MCVSGAIKDNWNGKTSLYKHEVSISHDGTTEAYKLKIISNYPIAYTIATLYQNGDNIISDFIKDAYAFQKIEYYAGSRYEDCAFYYHKIYGLELATESFNMYADTILSDTVTKL